MIDNAVAARVELHRRERELRAAACRVADATRELEFALMDVPPEERPEYAVRASIAIGEDAH